jgi:hypothetical protein
MYSHLLCHEVEVLCLRCQGGDSCCCTALAVQAVVVVQADNGGHVADQRVAVRVATWRRGRRGGGETCEYDNLGSGIGDADSTPVMWAIS